MEEKITIFYSKKNREKKSQNKKKMKGWRNCKVKVQNIEQWGDKKVKVSKCWRMCNCNVAN